MPDLLYRDDAYLQRCDATVTALTAEGGIITDRTVFYAQAGGQPGDRGVLTVAGRGIPITTTVYDGDKRPVHIPERRDSLPEPGASVDLALDWAIRYRNMRAHTLMHLLCACVPHPVTGGAISEDGGRIDFDIPEGGVPDKPALTALLNGLIAGNHSVGCRWISDEEMAANAHLIRTMSVKPPMGTGRVRLVMIGEAGAIDIQPCGGTHVRSTGEIGPVAVAKIESKGKINRRIRVVFA